MRGGSRQLVVVGHGPGADALVHTVQRDGETESSSLGARGPCTHHRPTTSWVEPSPVHFLYDGAAPSMRRGGEAGEKRGTVCSRRTGHSCCKRGTAAWGWTGIMWLSRLHSPAGVRRGGHEVYIGLCRRCQQATRTETVISVWRRVRRLHWGCKYYVLCASHMGQFHMCQLQCGAV
jgi:hypothetical protein